MFAEDGAMPLDDIRVLDLTVARAGPACVRQLADWGADVVRVEAPAEADSSGITGERRHGSDYQNLHRNKRSVAVDLKTKGGRDILWRLAATADVLVENMRPPVKQRLGFDYETIHIRNPRLVYGSISGFGQDGPYRERGGVDQIAQGMGGLMSVTGLPGTEPTRVGIPISDLAAGLYLAVGILVALHDRERTGEGRWVQTSLLESMIGMMDFQATRWTVDGDIPVQEGNHHPTLVPMGCFRTADGVLNVAGSGGRLLENFLSAVGLAELTTDPRFDTSTRRSANRSELNARIAERLQTRTTADWIEAFNTAGVPCGPVYRLDEVFADPQVQHLGLVTEVEHRVLGTQALVRNPVTIIDAGPTVRRPAPEIGEHTGEVLSELGLSKHELRDLRRQGVLQGSE
jgi:crotonobetainyl-CoA:carnitine CoA-transferase CaiB-like acyl-CoA transferase